MPLVTKNHDLRLPDWGPYTKRYTGISHIPDIKKGLRFDLAIVPGHYRRQVLVPNAKWESSHYAWEAAPDLSYYAYRYELEWKDQLYCDVSFSAVSDSARLVRCNFVNATDQIQNTVLHLIAYMNFPPVRVYSDEVVQPVTVSLPPGAVWVEALDYTDLSFAERRPTDNLVYDAMLRGEVRAHGLVNGSGIGQGFGRDAGDQVSYAISLQQPIDDAVLLVRCRLEDRGKTVLKFKGLANGAFPITDHIQFSQLVIPVGNLEAGSHRLELISKGGEGLLLDGFAVVSRPLVEQVAFTPHVWQPAPEILPGPTPNSLILKYADTNTFYGLAWDFPNYRVREILNDELDRFFRQMVHEHVQRVLRGPGDGHFTNAFLHPIPLPPHSQQAVFALACSGSRDEVEKTLAGFPLPVEQMESIYQSARARSFQPDSSESGKPYVFSQERMAATTLTNVTYPVYTRRTYIRHNTPGKWWDCLYTWDSGFAGLGLLELDLERAVDCLNAYVTDPGDEQAAFVHHGSLVPVQMYLFHELWNRTQDRSLLEYFYPRLRQYYQFLSGRLGSSTTRSMKSNLLKTWDYFYNSGGWDDYPPQLYIHKQRMEGIVSPAVTTAHAIRSAKILRSAALAIGDRTDLPLYDEDIQLFTQALQDYSWDEEAGYFSYVVHDETGRPRSFLRHESGVNYNMGMDGTAPLYAGICTPQQEERIVHHLFSPDHMWTRIGMSTVDQSAPYYRRDGYWNGAVWMPHQWFFWKALLDLGYGEKAYQTARTALDTYKAEVDDSYYCFEHFIVESGRGAGWHQFGGLSAPVLSWFQAYHKPGRISTGLDTWAHRTEFRDHNRVLEADLLVAVRPGRASSLVVTLDEHKQYCACWNGQNIPCREIHPGTMEVMVPAGEGRLSIQQREE